MPEVTDEQLAVVAERVMGWSRVSENDHYELQGYWRNDEGGLCTTAWLTGGQFTFKALARFRETQPEEVRMAFSEALWDKLEWFEEDDTGRIKPRFDELTPDPLLTAMAEALKGQS